MGATESSELLRQSRDLVEQWGRKGLATEYLVVEDTNHFTILDELTRPYAELFERVRRMAQPVHATTF